ncbi:hypothetical protein GJ496_001033 [Pomphorhynchus laevis]|nr:hypothetical protein GJ496_001033 [Pomphorhynchus laevis]
MNICKFFSFRSKFKSSNFSSNPLIFQFYRHVSSSRFNHPFAMIFDIDGVVLKGHSLIAGAREAIQKLNANNIPFIFLTNSDSNEDDKAKQLSVALSVHIDPYKVISAYSPMRMFTSLHSKRIVGFTNLVTLEDICSRFPELDYIDKLKRHFVGFTPSVDPNESSDQFDHILGVLLMGCPILWESNIQIILDLVATGGNLSRPRSYRLPFYVCNQDLTWKAAASRPSSCEAIVSEHVKQNIKTKIFISYESELNANVNIDIHFSLQLHSRIGHGSFVTVLEHLMKLTLGVSLQRDVVTGKPELITYDYLQALMRKHKLQSRSLYFVGDNPSADIQGANNFRKYLSNRYSAVVDCENSSDHEHVHSILLKSGIFVDNDISSLPESEKPDFLCEDIYEAVNVAFTRHCN